MGEKSYNKILFSSLLAIVSFILMLFNFGSERIFFTQVIFIHLFIIAGIYVLFIVYWGNKEAPLVSYAFFSLLLINSVIVFLNSAPNFWFPIIVAASILGMTESLYMFDKIPEKKDVVVKKIKQKYEKIAEQLKDISVDKPKIIVEKHGSEERIDPEELFARIKKRAEEIKKASQMARERREAEEKIRLSKKPVKKPVQKKKTTKTRKKPKKTKSKPKSSKEKLSFYDLKRKKKFSTNKYTFKKIKNRKFAVAKAPSGIQSYRLVANKKKKSAKKTPKKSTGKSKKPKK